MEPIPPPPPSLLPPPVRPDNILPIPPPPPAPPPIIFRTMNPIIALITEFPIDWSAPLLCENIPARLSILMFVKETKYYLEIIDVLFENEMRCIVG
jgi:hypothetical protein